MPVQETGQGIVVYVLSARTKGNNKLVSKTPARRHAVTIFAMFPSACEETRLHSSRP